MGSGHKLSAEEDEAIAREGEPTLDPEQRDVYKQALQALTDARVPFMLGGAFAGHVYTGIWRDTKDLDLFVKPSDVKPALDVLHTVGFEPWIEFEHWLAKAYKDPYFVDLIFANNNGVLEVDDSWFDHATETELAGVRVKVLGAEELISSKAWVAVRHRWDGPDIVHVLMRTRGQLDWSRVLELFGPYRELLLFYLLLFDFVYPGRSQDLPKDLMREIWEQVPTRWSEPSATESNVCRGILLDPFSFVVDIEDWGFKDPRDLQPLVDAEGELIQRE